MWLWPVLMSILGLVTGVVGVVLANVYAHQNDGKWTGFALVVFSVVWTWFTGKVLGGIILKFMGETKEALIGKARDPRLVAIYIRITEEIPDVIAAGWAMMLLGFLLISTFESPAKEVAIFLWVAGFFALIPYLFYSVAHDYWDLRALRGYPIKGSFCGWFLSCCGRGKEDGYDRIRAL